MWKYLSITLLVAIVIVIGGSKWAYDNYDETALEGWSESLRSEYTEWRDHNEERLVLVPDLPGIDPRDSEYMRGLKRTDYNFTSDWFSKKSPPWEVALKDFAGKPDVHYLEVGVYEGRSVIWMLENVLTHPSSHVTGIDIFYKLGEGDMGYSAEQQKIYEDNVILAGGEGRSTTLAEWSQIALRTLPIDSFDIIYIDGSHMATPVLEDAILSFRLLKLGGVLIFDDYRWFTTAPPLKSPRFAIDTFLQFFGDQAEVIHNNSQIIIVRTTLDQTSVPLNVGNP
jgi:predicted O-methyltransferase YrrM